MKQFLKSIVPPIIMNVIKSIRPNKYGWHGNYSTWEEAKKASTGYDSDEILNKVRRSLLKVKNGEAVYERDSVLFDKIQYSWPLLAGIMYAAAKSGGVLKVCDFGGSLGSTYYQNKKFLDGLSEVSWCVVEQKHFVEAGKQDFQDARLKYYDSISECVNHEKSNILVMASVLQYIELPHDLLDEILRYRFDFILIDRTPFTKLEDDVIKLQVVPPEIYTASYPCWFFSKKKFFSHFSNNGYRITEAFSAAEVVEGCEWLGFILHKEEVAKC